MSQFIRWFNTLSMADLPIVGGKNASLGEMITQLSEVGVNVPNGFATSTLAYDTFIEENGLIDKITAKLENLDTNDLLALQETGQSIRALLLNATFSDLFIEAISKAYEKLAGSEYSVAVRSSATAEDLPAFSFAGQQETYLNVKGIDNVLTALKSVYASLFNDRAIVYRKHHGFSDSDIKISAGIQLMVRSDLASSGVLFSIDPESGHDKVMLVTSAYGLGETVVQGEVNPDEFYLYKPNLEQNKPSLINRRLGSKKTKMIYTDSGTSLTSVPQMQQNLYSLTDSELEHLGQLALKIEKHYQKPMDIEWAKDGESGAIFIVQARPETVQSNRSQLYLEHYQLSPHQQEPVIEGRSIGNRIGQGKISILKNIEEMTAFQPGNVLVADMTDPDWEPIMVKASAIVTNRGGRTCHAAIIARELGIPAVVGCVDATEKLKYVQLATVSCAEGDAGYIYEGELDFKIKKIDLTHTPELPTRIMMNLGNPDKALRYAQLPNEGVGLARLEFIISNTIGIHPNALIHYETLTDSNLKQSIQNKIMAYENPKQFYIEKLTEAMATLAAAYFPKPVIFRMSDFKSNEYASLLGGHLYEPKEENPMIGFRGASRYISESFRAAFQLECEAVKKAREYFNLSNIKIMIPFVRTLSEAEAVIALLAQFGLKRGESGLEIYMMCELPSNALLADAFLAYFDGFSIGSNDLTQLTLGLDRDSSLLADQFDERDPAVKRLLTMAIEACLKEGKYIGICGQGPSDHPDLFQWLIEQKITSMSLNPDSILPMYFRYS